MMLGQLRAAIARGEPTQIEEILNQLPAYFSSDDVKKEAEKLAETLRSERETEEKAAVAQIDAAVQHAGTAVRAAKKAADLDAVLTELGKFRNQRDRNYNSPTVQAALNGLQSVQQFVTHWQDYLANLDDGNIDAATSALQNITNYSESANLIPRSEILARLQALKKPITPRGRTGDAESETSPAERMEQILAKTKTLKDMDGALKDLRKLQSESRVQNYNDPIIATTNALNAIEKTYREFLAGFPTTIEAPSGNIDAASPEIIPLKTQLLLLVLPRYLNLPSDLKANTGEAVQPFLERMDSEAKKRNDASLIARIHDAQRVLVRGPQVTTTSDNAALTTLSAAQNQEAAGQWTLAVVSYENALKTGSDAVPAKNVGDRLAAIQAAHPKEFEQGMELFLNPPQPMAYRMAGYPPNVPPNSPAYRVWLLRNGIQPDAAAPEKPVLSVPGGSPPPATSASPSRANTPSGSPTISPRKSE